MNLNEINEGARYAYSFNPQDAKQERRASRTGVKIAALMLACLMLGAAGGFLGAYLSPAPPSAETPAALVQLAPEPSLAEQLTASASGKLTLQEIAANCNPAVVAIAIEVTGRNAFGQVVNLPSAGSGFLISADGYIVTNNHVIEGASAIKVQMSDGKSYDAEVVGSDTYTDLAVLKINVSGLKHLTFGDSDGIRVGDQTAAIGNPLGQLANTFTVGYISALHREINIDGIPRTMLQTDAALNSGNSGGPLLNDHGYVIGVVAAKSSGSGVEGLGFAIPSNLAAGIVNQIIEHGSVTGRPYMGISAQTRVNNLGQRSLQVSGVEAGGGAEKAGIREGDYILEVDGTAVSSREGLLGVLYRLKAGDTVKVKLQRGQQTLTLDVTLGST